MRCCKLCQEPVKGVKSSQDGDSLDFCPMCDVVVEGQTIEIPDDEYESGLADKYLAAKYDFWDRDTAKTND